MLFGTQLRSSAMRACIVYLAFGASYAAAQTSPAPATSPTTQPATQPTVYSGADFQRQLSGFRGGSVLHFKPGIYQLNDTITLTASGIYDMTGVELRGHTGTLLWIRGSAINLIGPTFNSDKPATLPQGANPKTGLTAVIVQSLDVWIIGATWRNIDNGILLFPGQRFLTLLNPVFTDELRGDALYCGGGDESQPRGHVLWIGGSVANSQQEQNIRCSTPGFSRLECHGVSFTNTNGKECIGFRKGHIAKFVGCTFSGAYPTFLGEGLPQPLDACGDITFERCHFMDGPVDVRYCKDVRVLDCDFRTADIPVTVSDAQGVTVRGITRILRAPNMKPYFEDSTKSGGAITDLGGHTTQIANSATTAPAGMLTK